MKFLIKLWNWLIGKPTPEELQAELKIIPEKLRQFDRMNAEALAEKMLEKYRAETTPETLKALRTPLSQEKCDHLKGGRFKGLSVWKDYNVSFHRFPDGKARIRCLICGWTVWQGAVGWDEAMKMVDQSSNTPSSSEIVFDVTPAKGIVKQ